MKTLYHLGTKLIRLSKLAYRVMNALIGGGIEIARVEFFKGELPYSEPFTISLGTSFVSKNIVVKLVSKDGTEGWGEGSPSKKILGEDLNNVISSMRDVGKRIVMEDFITPEKMYKIIRDYTYSLAAAIEMAFLDLWSKSFGKPLYVMLGGPYRNKIPTDITIGIMKPEDQAMRAIKYVEKGFKILKLKLGLNPEDDVRRVEAVRDAVGEDVTIRVDANQGWSVEDAIRVINRIADYNVEYVEQPVKWDDIKGLARVRKESPLPIAVDEAVKEPRDIINIVQSEAADIVNIKLMKSKGILGAIRVAYVSEAAGLLNMIGCMGESRLGITAAVHVAASIANIVYFDLDSDILLSKDYSFDGSEIKRGYRYLPQKPGLGVRVNQEDLEKVFIVEKE